MTGVVVGLVLYSAVVLIAGPRLLRALTSSGASPRLGVAAWLSAIATVVVSSAASTVLIVIAVVGHLAHPRTAAASCVARLQHTFSGDAGMGPQIALFGMTAAAVVAALITIGRLVSAVAGMRSRAHEHARAVRLVGYRTGEVGVVMVKAAKPAAYCVAGRPSAIVVTSAATAALDEQQMAAVLAHERAHLAGHHAAIVSTMRAMAAAFPRLRLITEGTQQISRLLEMCADDVATRRHSRRALLSGLVALTTAAPAEALAAADLAVLARAERLASAPQRSVKVKAGTLLVSVIAIMAAAPLIAVTTCIWRPHIWGHGTGVDGNTISGAPFPGSPASNALGLSQSGKANSMMMMDHGRWGWGGWLLTTGTTIVFWTLIITAVVLLTRYLLSLAQRTTDAVHVAGSTHAEHTLADRYARGEIDDDEYQRRLALIREKAASTVAA